MTQRAGRSGWSRRNNHVGAAGHQHGAGTRLEIEVAPAGGNPLSVPPTEYGKPFSGAGFGNWFGERCGDAQGWRDDRGATERQLMKLFGWTTLGQPSDYVARADDKRLASAAVRLIAGIAGE